MIDKKTASFSPLVSYRSQIFSRISKVYNQQNIVIKFFEVIRW
jgi:hypothetical protein